MKNNLILARVSESLPSLLQPSSYNELSNMFETPSYVTDRAGYYQGARLSDKIAVVFNLADGLYYKFLNGVKIFGSDGKGHTRLLTEMAFPMCEGVYWSESTGRQVAESLLTGYIQDQCAVLGIPRPSKDQARQVACSLIGETAVFTERLGTIAAEDSWAAIGG